MSGEHGEQNEPRARQEGSAGEPSGAPRHFAVIGGEASHASPWRWVLLIVPVLLIAAGGTYLVNLWMAPMQQGPDERRVNNQHAMAPEKAQRRAPAQSSGVDGGDSGFDVQGVLRLLPRADPGAGANVFKMCAVCHVDEKGGPHKVGNNLWNVVGAPKAAAPNYRYSQALKADGGTWSYRELAEYLHDPRQSVPGTSMAFFGIKDNQRMANLLAYMRTRADKVVPLPR